MAKLEIERKDTATTFGSESVAYIATCDLSSGTAVIGTWTDFPCVISQKLDMEPKTGQIEDDRGRIVYSYSQPSKVKYSASIFQRDAKTFEFLRNNADSTFVMWVVVGQIGDANQEILMYGKLGGNYSEDMSADPKIPIEFNCLVNNIAITATAPEEREAGDFASSITLQPRQMVIKKDTLIT